MHVALNRAYGQRLAAEKAFHRSLAETFPVGCQVSYLHGQHNRVAEVVGHSLDRIQLIGTMGVTYWKNWNSSFERLEDVEIPTSDAIDPDVEPTRLMDSDKADD